ncbi:hypothetical protein ABT373_10115 [Streptomyces sp. NPDC000070]|uniref:hypothetical protein n=1 Tax=Streptomyces sp. NPDC000070 TaxID=3154240 RepID=UPI0033306534
MSDSVDGRGGHEFHEGEFAAEGLFKGYLRQHLIDTRQLPGTNGSDLSEWLRPASVSPSWRPSWPSTGELPNCWVR